MRRRIALAAVVVGVWGLGLGPAGGEVGPAASVTVTPSSDLADGQHVQVHAAGLAGRGPSELPIQQCRVNAGLESCRVLADVRPSATGQIDVEVSVWAQLPDGTDCRIQSCEIRIDDDGFRPAILITAPLAFDPVAPLAPPASLSADPSADLRDGEVVQVDVTGLGANESVFFSQCATGHGPGDGGCRTLWGFTADRAGEIHRLYAVHISAGDGVDCRTDPCELRILEDDYLSEARTLATAALAFDPSGGPRPPHTLTATPDQGLVDGQTVVVDARDFDQEGTYTPLHLIQCSAAGGGVDVHTPQPGDEDFGFDRCDLRTLESDVFPDVYGRFQASLTVHRTFVGENGVAVDCLAEPCVITSPQFGEPPTAPIGFAPVLPTGAGPGAVEVQPRFTG